MISSYIFYGWWDWTFLFLILFTSVCSYCAGLVIGNSENKKIRKLVTIANVFINLMILFVYKYYDFFILNFLQAFESIGIHLSLSTLKLVLPVGISFYTFQVISYTVDVYRGSVQAQKNLLTFAAYVAMFPQLVAGPIVRYSDIRSQLENRMHSVEKCAYGIRRFVTGLSKKILIANVLGELIGQFQASEEKSVLFFWMYAVAFMLQIYFDFSGYSDMAVGLGAVFGFDFPENFRYPYCSASIT
ncbi:MAG: MBOAT family protein, partial [Bacteroidales bacterium]|nr:MBOAT family protein [Bacteroidales bacterium]